MTQMSTAARGQPLVYQHHCSQLSVCRVARPASSQTLALLGEQNPTLADTEVAGRGVVRSRCRAKLATVAGRAACHETPPSAGRLSVPSSPLLPALLSAPAMLMTETASPRRRLVLAAALTW